MRDFVYTTAVDQSRSPAAVFTRPFFYGLSLLYGLGVMSARALQRIKRVQLPVKVISVGNITWGGTGKTPFVALVARFLSQEGRHPAVLTRGYGRQGSKRGAGNAAQAMGDEPAMLARKLPGVPVIVDSDRRRAAMRAVREYGADTVVLDDGFQQWRLKKDLDIVTIDAVCPFGNGRLIPRGILREPPGSLRRADVVVLTKTNLAGDLNSLKSRLAHINPAAAVMTARHTAVTLRDIVKPQSLISLDSLRGRTVAVFSGIADPASFENLLSSAGVSFGMCARYQDHHAYSQKDIDTLLDRCRAQNVGIAVTTEKDASRISPDMLRDAGMTFLFLQIEIEVTEGWNEFVQRLRKLYSV